MRLKFVDGGRFVQVTIPCPVVAPDGKTIVGRTQVTGKMTAALWKKFGAALMEDVVLSFRQ